MKRPASASGEVLTLREHTLVRAGLHVVERAAKWVSRRYRRFFAPEDLLGIGTIALYAAARDFDDAFSHDFASFAHHRVRCAMLKAVDDELYQDRVRRAVDIAVEQFWAYLTDRDYDASKHDDHEARRRFRAIANGMLSAAFMAGVEEAQRATPESDAAEREEYERAIHALRAALQRLSDADHQLLVLLYRELKDLKEASALLGIPYSTVRRRHQAALARLRELIVAAGVGRAPVPRDLLGEPTLLLLRASLTENDERATPEWPVPR